MEPVNEIVKIGRLWWFGRVECEVDAEAFRITGFTVAVTGRN